MTAPNDTGSVFEPFIVVDPDDPDRMIAGAQFGNGYNRGGLRFWMWQSDDGGTSWDGRESMLSPLKRTPTMAADLSMAFGPDGTAYLFGIFGDSVRAGVPDAALALAAQKEGGRVVEPLSLLGRTIVYAPGAFEVSDKPWITTDRQPKSPFHGRLYFAWTRVSVRLDTDPISVTRKLVLSFSEDGGLTGSPEFTIATEGMGAQLAVRPDGTLDVVWLGKVNPDEPGEITQILGARSMDGGQSFSDPHIIAATPDSVETMDLPTLADDGSGQLLACWPRGTLSDTANWAIWCSKSGAEGAWSEPLAAIMPDSAATAGYPAVAWAGSAWWLLYYESNGPTTSVLLSRSVDGRSFEVKDTLASIPLARADFCQSPMLPCRRDLEKFTPGDYIKLAASKHRLAAAHVLPLDGNPENLAEMWVSIIDLTGQNY